ncbi:N-acetyltransferase (plasmid) [Pseudomonas yamanorum]|nr:N-acetyltransferase [Pseudomonas yamanorum]
MDVFEPMRDFFHRRQAKNLSELASTVRVVTESTLTIPGSFVYPGRSYVAGIQIDGQRIGYVNYSINPLNDRLYIDMIKVDVAHRHQGMALSALWSLWMTYQVPIVPVHQYDHLETYWDKTRQRFAAAGALIDDQLHGMSELNAAKQRWQHLVPEAEDKRLIRADWEWVAAEHAADRPAGPGIR